MTWRDDLKAILENYAMHCGHADCVVCPRHQEEANRIRAGVAHLDEAARLVRMSFETLPPDGMVVHRPSTASDEAIGSWLGTDELDRQAPSGED